MTDEQGTALARLMRDRPTAQVGITPKPFDLPSGYIFVMFTTPVPGGSSTYVCGVAPDGSVSS